MNIEPSSEEIKGSNFNVLDHNKRLGKRATSLPWGKETRIQKCKDITKRDQFGLSLEVSISNKKYFLKLPPGLEATAANLTEEHIKEHYAIMQKRFEDEFEKCPTFQHVIDRCDGAMFSIARPLASCVLPKPNSDIKLPGLIYEFIKGDDLSKRNALSKYEKNSEVFLKIARGLTRLVQLIHNQGVLHSFLVPRNIIKSGDRYVVVGFGYSSFCDSRHHAPTLKVSDADRCYLAPECHEKENLGALWFPVDIYSIGAILYQIATGNIPNTPEDPLPRDVTHLKEHIYDKLSDRKNGYKSPSKIFTENENILKILDRCLRYNPEDRFSCAEELLEALVISAQATGSSPRPRRGSNIRPSNDIRIYNILANIVSEKPRNGKSNEAKPAIATTHPNFNHLFNGLLHGWCGKAVEDAERMQRGHYEIYGHRDLLVTSLCHLLAGAKEHDVYRTMTLPSYWTDKNLGSNGRFLTMNKHMARQGLNIERIFLVNKSFHELTEREQEILEFQLEAERNVNKGPKKGSFRVMVKEINDEKMLADFETNGTLVAYLAFDVPENGRSENIPENALCLNFVSHGHYEWLNGHKMIEHSIKKIRYWIPKDDFRKKAFKSSHDAFINKWQNAISLEEYIGKNQIKSLEELLIKGQMYIGSK